MPTMTAAERREKSLQLRDSRNYRYALNAYTQQLKAEQQAQTIAELKQKQEARERQNANFFLRAVSTIGDVAANVVTGALKGIEGIYDLGAGIVGAVGGIFDSNFQKAVQDHIAYDFVGTNIGQHLQNLTKYSLTNDGGWFGQLIENVSSGVGQMLPAVIVTAVTAGAGVGALGQQIASLATLGISAAGNSTEEAYNDGASYWGGLGYGLASGAVEVGTEMMFGGGKENIFGKGFLDNAAKKATTRGIKKVALNALEEGAEEAVSELVNPLLRNIYKKKGFFDDFLTTEHLKNIGQSALVGAATSVAYGETVGRIGRAKANIRENLQGLDSIARKEENLWAKNDSSQDGKINEIRQELYKNISDELTSMKPKARQQFIEALNENFNTKGVFNADGTIIEQSVNTAQNKANNKVASFNKEAYSPRLRGKENSLIYAPTNKALTQAQIEAKRSFNALNKGNRQANLVFTSKSLGKDSYGQFVNSAYVDGTLYISTKANASEAIVKYEMTHSLEGTKAYNKYAQYILKEISDNETLKQKYGDIEQLYEDTLNAYTNQLLNEEMKKSKNKLSREVRGEIEALARRSTIQEIVARYTSENLFTNQEQILKFGEQEPGLLKKIANWVKNKTNKLYKGTAEQIETAKFLDKASKLYNKALEQSFGVQFDNKVREVYNKEKGDSENAREQGRSIDSNKSEERIESKDSSRQNEGIQGESRESGRESNQGISKENVRRYGYEEKVVMNTKIKAVKARLDYTDSEMKVYRENKKFGLNTVFYEGSAIPLTEKITETDPGYDGFVDIKNKTVYLRSDNTVSFEALQEDNYHEQTHFFAAQAREEYNVLKETLFNQLSKEQRKK